MSTSVSDVTDTIRVVDFAAELEFTFEDLRRYSGPRSVGGLAHAFKVMQRVLPLLTDGGPPERREISVRTAHPGPGVRDGVEMVTRAVTEGRFHHDPGFERTDAGEKMAWWVFEFTYRGRIVTAHTRDEFVPAELMRLAKSRFDFTDAEREQFLAEIRKMSKLVLSARADDIYDIVD